MQGHTSGVTAESTVLASHQVPYSDGVTRFGCSSYTYAPQRYIIYSNLHSITHNHIAPPYRDNVVVIVRTSIGLKVEDYGDKTYSPITI